MKILNLRVGAFNTNSSSSHSVIFTEDTLSSRRPDYWGGEVLYGWENFTLTSPEAKTHYLISQLYPNNPRVRMPPGYVEYLQSKIGGEKFGSIDHDSRWTWRSPGWVPQTLSGDICFELIDDLVEWFCHPNIIVLGGNDNSEGHPDRDAHDTLAQNKAFPTLFLRHPSFDVEDPWFEADYFSTLFSMSHFRKDCDVWFGINKENGTRTFFTFKEGVREMPRAQFPATADVKITGMCPFGCHFCYQGSTNAGLHASYETLVSLAGELAKGGCMEVALGGGEPTLHPRFWDLLNTFAMLGVVPNFTTKNTKIFSDPRLVEMQDVYGGFAFSVQTVEEIEKVAALAGEKGLREKLTLHIVMGVQSLDDTMKLLIAASGEGLKVTLLGYKATHRGQDVTPHPYSGWVDRINQLNAEGELCFYNPIAADTKLIAESLDELKGVKNILFDHREGFSSCYVDAVANKIAPCSFCPEDMYLPLDNKNLKRGWESINVYKP